MKESDKIEEARRREEQLDTVRFDGDIDLDREKTREQLGFRDDAPSEKRQRMEGRMAAAKAEADRRNAARSDDRPPMAKQLSKDVR